MLQCTFYSRIIFPFRVYAGHHTFLISPYDLELNPILWLSVVSNNKGERVMMTSAD